jgi:hypothetical protein
VGQSPWLPSLYSSRSAKYERWRRFEGITRGINSRIKIMPTLGELLGKDTTADTQSSLDSSTSSSAFNSVANAANYQLQSTDYPRHSSSSLCIESWVMLNSRYGPFVPVTWRPIELASAKCLYITRLTRLCRWRPDQNRIPRPLTPCGGATWDGIMYAATKYDAVLRLIVV